MLGIEPGMSHTLNKCTTTELYIQLALFLLSILSFVKLPRLDLSLL